jgi:hypothetical protein
MSTLTILINGSKTVALSPLEDKFSKIGLRDSLNSSSFILCRLLCMNLNRSAGNKTRRIAPSKAKIPLKISPKVLN